MHSGTNRDSKSICLFAASAAAAVSATSSAAVNVAVGMAINAYSCCRKLSPHLRLLRYSLPLPAIPPFHRPNPLHISTLSPRNPSPIATIPCSLLPCQVNCFATTTHNSASLPPAPPHPPLPPTNLSACCSLSPSLSPCRRRRILSKYLAYVPIT